MSCGAMVRKSVADVGFPACSLTYSSAIKLSVNLRGPIVPLMPSPRPSVARALRSLTAMMSSFRRTTRNGYGRSIQAEPSLPAA